MNKMSPRQRKLAKYLLEEKGWTWEEYIKRFDATTPLQLWETNIYPRKLAPSKTEWDVDDSRLICSSSYGIKKLQREYKITAYFTRRVEKEEIENMPYLDLADSSLEFLLHRNIIEIMQRICPEDFEPMSVTLVNLCKNTEYFEIKDFYYINLLKCIDALDQDKSVIDWSENHVAHFKKLRYKENPWQDGCIELPRATDLNSRYKHFKLEKPCKLAIDAISGVKIWHPELAKELPQDSYHWFVRDEDQFFWRSIL